MKKCWLVFVGMVILFNSCTGEDNLTEPTILIVPEIIEGEYVRWNLAPEEKVRICCGTVDTIAVRDWKIRWFETRDRVDFLIGGAINNYYDVKFEEKGIKNLKCEVTYTRIENDSTEVKEYPFYVAFTGLPALSITTENGQAVENKTDKIPGNLMLAGGGQI